MPARADVALGVAPVLSLAMHDPEGSLRKILRGLIDQATGPWGLANRISINR